jgi:hypothetical protein
MKNIFIKSIAISAFIALTGCGGSSSGDTSNDSSDGGSAQEEVKVVAIEAGTHSTVNIKSDGSLWGVFSFIFSIYFGFFLFLNGKIFKIIETIEIATKKRPQNNKNLAQCIKEK